MNCSPFILLPNGNRRLVSIIPIKGKKLFADVMEMSWRTAEQVEMFANTNISQQSTRVIVQSPAA